MQAYCDEVQAAIFLLSEYDVLRSSRKRVQMLDLSYPTITPGPPRPGRILLPKGHSRHHGQERHVIPGTSTRRLWGTWQILPLMG